MIKKLAVYHQFQINRPKYAFKINPPNFTEILAVSLLFLVSFEKKKEKLCKCNSRCRVWFYDNENGDRRNDACPKRISGST